MISSRHQFVHFNLTSRSRATSTFQHDPSPNFIPGILGSSAHISFLAISHNLPFWSYQCDTFINPLCHPCPEARFCFTSRIWLFKTTVAMPPSFHGSPQRMQAQTVELRHLTFSDVITHPRRVVSGELATPLTWCPRRLVRFADQSDHQHVHQRETYILVMFVVRIYCLRQEFFVT